VGKTADRSFQHFSEKNVKRLSFVLFAAFFAVSTAQAEIFSTSATRAEIHRIPENRKPTLDVVADAEILVKPDRLNVVFGIEERSKNLRAAKERMNRVIRDAIAFCKAHGVQEKHIQTTHIRISPDYRHNDEVDRIVLRYYELSQSIALTLDLGAIEKYDEIVFGLIDRGINVMGSPSFSTTELRKHRDKARLLAIKAAQEKAKLLTDASGIVLGKAVDITENQNRTDYPWQDRWMNQRMNFSQNLSQNISQQMPSFAPEGGVESGSVASGMISVKASVTITYELGEP
jgi:uncharacterized protein YggE